MEAIGKGLAGKLAAAFIDNKLTGILVIVSFFLGFIAVMTTPKQEDPDIVVPMIDVIVQYPGATPPVVEKKVVEPIEHQLWQLKDIEYLYSAAGDGWGIVTARFYVGTDPVKALVELNSKLMEGVTHIPDGVKLPPLIMSKSIDDVPILTLTLWGKNYDSYELYRIAAALEEELTKINEVSDVFVVGGEKRKITVYLDPQKLEAYHVNPLQVIQVLKAANFGGDNGFFVKDNRVITVQTGKFIKDKRDVENIVVAVYRGKPVFLKDIAKVVDGPGEVKHYVLFGTGPAHEEKGIKEDLKGELPAVTIAVAKKKGTNAVDVAEKVLKAVERMKGTIIPDDVHVTVTRNYGKTAEEKFDELIKHLFIATFSVVLLIAVALGWREAIVVGITVPVILALTLFFSKLYGFTLNRVTLFALIFSIGVLVDAAIVVIENIHRWMSMGKVTPREAIILATDEVGNPNILATATIIAALIPMAFVGGLMGPYMRPIPINASTAIALSALIAFTITPWAAYLLLKNVHVHEEYDVRKTFFWKLYTKIVVPLITSPAKKWAFYLTVLAMLAFSLWMLVAKLVVVKLLPYDNKSELNIVIDMPEGTSLEETARVAKTIADEIVKKQNIVTDYQIYVGTAAPFDFNGLVRHYYLRKYPWQAEIHINLVDKEHRAISSHEFAKLLRKKVHPLAKKLGVKNLQVVEIPPGPPVLSPIVAEVYNHDYKVAQEVAWKVRQIFEESPSITDVAIYADVDRKKYRIEIDEQKAKQNGLDKRQIWAIVAMALYGYDVTTLKTTDFEKVPLIVKFPEGKVSGIDRLLNTKIMTPLGKEVPLKELVKVEKVPVEHTIYRKNMRRVVYVCGDVAGKYEAPIYSILDVRDKVLSIPNPYGKIEEYWYHLPPAGDKHVAIKWDGEMHITIRVFKDLGLAFAGAVFLIWVLILAWFKDYRIPGIIMAPIPLTLVGIIPGHWLMDKIMGNVFFTATSMIGFIALAGIIIRNSILLVDFAEQRLREGVPLHVAVVESGVIRTRPVLLTAAALIVGAFVIIFDPIFNGLAVSLIFGTIGSTTLTLVLIPVMYYYSKLKRLKKQPGYVVPSPEEVKKDLLAD
ncbi:MAG TPA: efflux RND transporter permease subunit [Aquificales bacterium]|nr:efflux RND transporter permease subunit [Aquificales bacterium]